MAAPLRIFVNKYYVQISCLRQNSFYQPNAFAQIAARSSSSDVTKSSTQGSTSCPSPSATTKHDVGNAGAAKAQKINKAMVAYLERAEAHNAFMSNEISEFEIGRRHLANIMGVNPDEFTQEDIDAAIEYLLPSGLFDKKARQKLKHPEEILPKRKVAQFGMDGRPFHSFFYTGKPNYVDLMHSLAWKLEAVKAKDLPGKVEIDKEPEQIQLAGSDWLDKKTVETRLHEPLSDAEYQGLVNMLEFICKQRYAADEKTVIFTYRTVHQHNSRQQQITQPQQDEKGRTYQEAVGRRRHTKATLRLYAEGTGRYTVNGRELLEYFPDLYHRKEIMFPLHFTDRLGCVDFEAEVDVGGTTCQAGAIRHALSLALQGFVGDEMVERMRLAGLLTQDPRLAERKKPGQAGARRKYTWKKR